MPKFETGDKVLYDGVMICTIIRAGGTWASDSEPPLYYLRTNQSHSTFTALSQYLQHSPTCVRKTWEGLING